MAEKVSSRLRVRKIEFADPIKNAAGYASAVWDPQPYVLADDEVVITQEDLEEDAVEVHNLDAPISVEYSGGKLSFSGSFTEASFEQLKKLIGDVASSGMALSKPAKAFTLQKAIRITDAQGNVILIPNAAGYVKLDLNFSKKGRAKFPFKFIAQAASDEWQVDLAYPTQV